MRVYFLLFCVYSVTSGTGEENDKRKIAMEILSKFRTVIHKDYHMVTRQVSTSITMFENYGSVVPIVYSVPLDVTDARFTFQADQLHMNSIGSCDVQDVVVVLKRGAFAPVNPDGFKWPKKYIDPDTRDLVHTIELKSNNNSHVYSVKTPVPGSWYALIFIKWQDPRSQKVEQQGLVADCDTFIYSDLQVRQQNNVELMDCFNGIEIDYDDIPAYFKCMSQSNPDPIGLNITVKNTANSAKVLVRVQALTLPSEENYLVACAFDPKLGNVQTVTFSPFATSWHYIQIDRVENSSRYADCESYFRASFNDEDVLQAVSDLMRHDNQNFFSFDYAMPTPRIADSTSLINITSTELTSLRFEISKFADVGGNLIIEVSLIMLMKFFMGYKRPEDAGFTDEHPFFKVVICLDNGHTSIPLQDGQCKYNDKLTPALFVLNTTDSDSIYDMVTIPYPEDGDWFLTFRQFCDSVVCPCRTSHNGTQYHVDTDSTRKNGTTDGKNISEAEAKHTRQGTTYCNATVVLSILSSPCIKGTCQNEGECEMNMQGSVVLSYCECSGGYGGWDCSDASRMDSRLLMLVSILLLTLSNLCFLLSIYVASIRLYYTEAIMYFFTMLCSILYHACDAPPQIRSCITMPKLLQFADFYCGILCFWVTLLAMSVMGNKMRASLQLSGAIVIALLTRWHMRSFISFVLPVTLGILILLISLFVDYMRAGSMRYPKVYFKKYLPIGLGLVAIGLVIYAFLQTAQNYMVVHSIWHSIIALSVLFLLPDVRREGNQNPFLPSKGYCKLHFRSYFSRPRPPAPVVAVNGNQPIQPIQPIQPNQP